MSVVIDVVQSVGLVAVSGGVIGLGRALKRPFGRCCQHCPVAPWTCGAATVDGLGEVVHCTRGPGPHLMHYGGDGWQWRNMRPSTDPTRRDAT